jgi:hypothetical protein
MLPGPDQIIACPHCRGLAKYGTLESGNTFRTRMWADAKQLAPMWPEPPAVVKCRHCARCYWLADADKLGGIRDTGKPIRIGQPRMRSRNQTRMITTPPSEWAWPLINSRRSAPTHAGMMAA